MKKDNKGFSLVELIIVVAIMAVLIGILAPQYLKYVQRSKVSTDITNAQELATAINVAITDGVNVASVITSGTPVAGGASLTDASGVALMDGLTVMPTSRVDATYNWVVNYTTANGVTTITLGGDQIYPDAADYHTTND